MHFSKDVLHLDPAVETERIVQVLRQQVRRILRRGGAVVGISGGVDSAVVFVLCIQAFGPDKVVALILPDRDSSPESEALARELAAQFGVTPTLENLTPALEGFGCYRRRDEAVRRVFPEYDAAAGYRVKIVLPPNLLDADTLNAFSVTIISPDGADRTKPLPAREFMQIVASSNLKQRSRMAMLYHYAELHNYAVIGTANKNEHDQGFFVRYGDSGVDVQAIGHLYKTQIYQLAEHLHVPEAIQRRLPTTDTYSAPCSQEEFFFRLPFAIMDLLWYAQEHQVPASEVARVMGLTETQVQRAFADFARKHRTTEYLRMAPISIPASV
jgi:NAD+ synthase